MRFLSGIIAFFLSLSVYAQEIQVFDKETNEPLPNVAIYNPEKTKSTLTNFDGFADITKFSTNEILIFKHVSHDEVRLRKFDITRKNHSVYLTGNENELEQVILSVSKFEMSKEDIPHKIVSITPEDIKFYSPQTSADLLENTGQVYVQKSQLGGGSPMIRGFATNRLLITVDGVRMNTAIFRSGNLQNIISIDPLAVESSEVIIGPGSVVYGSDAIGGVMNFYMLSPNFSFNGKTSVSGNAYTRYATANNEKTIHTDVNIGWEKWASQTSVTYSDFGDLKMGKYGPEEYLRTDYAIRRDGEDLQVENPDPRVQKPTGYNQINLLEKIKFMPDGNWDFNLGLIYSTTSDYPRYDRLYRKREGVLRSAEWHYGPQTWFLGNLKINKTGDGKVYDKAQFTAAYQYFAESRNDRNFGEEILFTTEENVGAYSFNLDFEKRFQESRIFYGLEYVINNVNSEGESINISSEETNLTASRYPDNSSWQSLAAYGSYQWKIRENLAFQSGLRYNWIILNANFDAGFYDFPFGQADVNTGALTGSAGVNWQQNSSLGWRLNFSTAFRAPNIDDIGKIFDSEPGAVVVPNPGLKPEYVYNGELGLDWTPAENIRFEFAGFYTYLDNAMVRRDFDLDGEKIIDYQGEPSRVQAIQNSASAYVYGFEGGMKIDFSVAFRLTSQLTITEGKEKEGNDYVPLRHAAPVFGNTHLLWHKKRLKLDLYGEYNGEFAFEDLAPSEQSKEYLYAIDDNGNPYSPAWYTINLAAQYTLSEHWKATASLENITNQLYRTYSSGISAAGRNFILALNYSF
ncbi:TonB-dependent receptor [Autumnicola psychrophila]|uniref:TonB-dependent receptor n=1 Tax=Autumnicola psychrophila TaxID=3075592 RepID=A0ABU3DNW7_9FLAO|nr:TonB-dependent receptor [Zunongwangia sp. F225]MDT0685395.1 TonB-dependent receptor [Zunongwangia sp. F225]